MAGGVELATAYVSLVVEGSKVAPGVKKAMGVADPEAARAGDRAGRSFTSRFGSALKIGGALAAAFAAKKGIEFLGDAVAEASDLGESLNALNVTYGKNARGVKALGREAADAMGLSNVEFNNLAVQFSAFSSTIAGKGGNVVGTLEDLTTRGADFASVMNIGVNDAMELFQSGLAGETEPLRRYGIDLSAAAVGAFAVSEGIAKSADKMTEAQKVQARYKLLMEQTAKTQGDFTNTSDSLANSQRRLGAQWDNIKAQVGQELLPVFQDLSNWIADDALPAVSDFFDEFRKGKGTAGDIKDGLNDAKDAVANFFDEFKENRGFGGDVRDVLEDVRDATMAAAGYAKDFVGWFNDMPAWAKKAIIGGGIAVAAGSKLGLTKFTNPLASGASSLLGKSIGVQKVFETNPAALGGGPGGGPGGAATKVGVVPSAGALLANPAFLAVFAGVTGFLANKVTPGGDKAPASTTPYAEGAPLPGDTFRSGAFNLGASDTEALKQAAGWDKITAAVQGTLTSFQDLKAAVAGADDGLAEMVARNPDKAIGKLQTMADLAGVSVGELTDKLPKTAAAMEEAGYSAEGAKIRTGSWRDTIIDLAKRTDDVDGKKPKVAFDFPGLPWGLDTTGKLIRDVDEAGRKKPKVVFDFPNLPFGVDKVWELKRGMDQLDTHKDIYITTHYSKTYGGLAGGGGHEAEPRAMGGPVYAGQPYVVGERGPELVVPRASAQVVPNGATLTVDLSERSLRAVGKEVRAGSFKGTRAGSSDKASALHAARRT